MSIVVALNKSGCINQFSVLEWGTLGFSRLFCEAVHKLYQAVSYVPPFGSRVEKRVVVDLKDSVEAAEICCKVFHNIEC